MFSLKLFLSNKLQSTGHYKGTLELKLLNYQLELTTQSRKYGFHVRSSEIRFLGFLLSLFIQLSHLLLLI